MFKGEAENVDDEEKSGGSEKKERREKAHSVEISAGQEARVVTAGSRVGCQEPASVSSSHQQTEPQLRVGPTLNRIWPGKSQFEGCRPSPAADIKCRWGRKNSAPPQGRNLIVDAVRSEQATRN